MDRHQPGRWRVVPRGRDATDRLSRRECRSRSNSIDGCPVTWRWPAVCSATAARALPGRRIPIAPGAGRALHRCPSHGAADQSPSSPCRVPSRCSATPADRRRRHIDSGAMTRTREASGRLPAPVSTRSFEFPASPEPWQCGVDHGGCRACGSAAAPGRPRWGPARSTRNMDDHRQKDGARHPGIRRPRCRVRAPARGAPLRPRAGCPPSRPARTAGGRIARPARGTRLRRLRPIWRSRMRCPRSPTT